MKKLAIVLASAMMLGGCASVDPAQPILGGTATANAAEEIIALKQGDLKCGQIDEATAFELNIAAACAGLDLLKSVGASKSGVSSIDAGSGDNLDKALYLALKGDPSTVEVSFDGDKILLDDLEGISEPSPTDPPIFYWLDRIADTGGENVPCRAQKPEGIAAILAKILFGVVVEKVENWVTYSPAKNYNALVTFDSTVEGRPIRSVTFSPRSEGVPVCPTDSPTES